MSFFKKHFNILWLKIPKPYEDLKDILEHYNSAQKAPEILYLGDSVLSAVSRNDSDTRTLGNMLVDSVGKNNVGMFYISRSAANMRLYFHLLKVLSFTHQKPKLVILPINMRSFSSLWDKNPEYAHDGQISILQKYAKNPSKGILLVKSPDFFPADWKNTEVELPFTSLNRIDQILDLIAFSPSTPEEKTNRKKQIFIYHYLEKLDAGHPKLLYLGRIVELLRQQEIDLLLYVTPINYQSGIRHVGNGFVQIIRSNVTVVRSYLSSYIKDESVNFIDFEELLPSKYFFHADEATEHLNEHGRLKLVRNILNVLPFQRQETQSVASRV